MRGCCLVSLGISGVLLFILGLLTTFYFNRLIDPMIYEELQIKNGSDMYSMWVDPPIIPHVKWYFFNMTNPHEFMHNGAKPILKQVGPYTYRETWHRENIEFFPNGTVSYATKKRYFFEPSMSVGSEDDHIHTLNVPVVVAVDRVKNMERLAQLALSSMLAVLNETAFITKTVKEFLWGYEDPLLDIGNKFLPPDKKIPFDKFGFFYKKNGSIDGILNVFTGENGMENYSILDKFNGSRYLKFWETDECNRVDGTDGTSFPPAVTRNTILKLFNINICRTLPLVYHSEVEHFGIKGYRFSPSPDVFANVSTKPENKCYCVGGPPCIGSGVFNISACQMDTPSVLSWPHFYQADQKYLDAVVGLKPEADKHALFIDVAPRTGSPLRAQARIQINFATTRVKHIKAVANMTSMVFPVVWFEDGVTELPENLIDLLRLSSNVPEVARFSILLAAFILSAVSFMACLAMWYTNRHKQSDIDVSAPKRIFVGEVNPAMVSD